MLKSGYVRFAAGFIFMLFLGYVVFPYALYERHEQPIQFSHKIHTQSAGLSCQDCHAFRDDGRFSGIPTLSKCAECHSQTVGTSAEEKKLVDDYVSRNREIPWLIYAKQPQNAFFPHAPHVKLANLACDKCHGPHGSSDSLRTYERDRITGYSRDLGGAMWTIFPVRDAKGLRMDDCAECHEKHHVGNTCLKCHK